MVGWILLTVLILSLAGMGRWLYHQGYAHGWENHRWMVEQERWEREREN